MQECSAWNITDLRLALVWWYLVCISRNERIFNPTGIRSWADGMIWNRGSDRYAGEQCLAYDWPKTVGYVSWMSLTRRTGSWNTLGIMYNGFLHVSCLLKHIQLMHNLIVYLGHNVSAYEYCSRNFKFSALLPWDCGLAKLPVVKIFLADPLVGPCHWHATVSGWCKTLYPVRTQEEQVSSRTFIKRHENIERLHIKYKVL